MVQTSTLALAAGAGLAAEATGVVNVVPGFGKSSGGGGGQGRQTQPTGLPPAVAAMLGGSGGGIPDGLLAALAADNQGRGVSGDALAAILSQTRNAAGGTSGIPTDAVASLLQQQRSAFTSTIESVSSTTVPTVNVNTAGTSGTGGDGGSRGTGGRPTAGSFDLQDLAGTRPFGVRGLGTTVATVGEAGQAGGKTAGAAGSFVQQNPIFTGAVAAGLASPLPGDVAVTAPLGALAEVTADRAPGAVDYATDAAGAAGRTLGAAGRSAASAVRGADDAVAGAADFAAGRTDEFVGGLTSGPLLNSGDSSSGSSRTSKQARENRRFAAEMRRWATASKDTQPADPTTQTTGESTDTRSQTTQKLIPTTTAAPPSSGSTSGTDRSEPQSATPASGGHAVPTRDPTKQTEGENRLDPDVQEQIAGLGGGTP